MNTITKTKFNFPKQKSLYKGKVRDVYQLKDDTLIMIATDRISAFDAILPKGIPYKGQILNQMAVNFLQKTEDIVPNWLIASPDPNVSIGQVCEPLKVEMVIRGYLAGHAARIYKQGVRKLSGVALPEGLRENDIFPQHPIITPATKAEQGLHDEDISREDLIRRGIVSEEDYRLMEKYTYALFARGSEIAAQHGLILVDTKYEFGKTRDGEIVLIDEIHTPDSSRYFYKEGYEERQENGQPQIQLSKEFVRQWLISQGFQGEKGQKIPPMSDEYVQSVSERYIELYEQIMGEKFVKADTTDIEDRIYNNVMRFLEQN
ncbi:phosphoribosylaminoimidazolesuccinocarboxamide synthase [Capnocytophaga sp. Marseille-Q4570]|jgi:phosphoribosylaminoimidazolesuccinocarboxamide synthase|uniref:Phosphoribosylaminoimidazole-succinocarboxamide synthase n=1 Tax=Capnocytophaga bilenii TaxID=2819369 RepID=A0ABS3Q0P4_9FLAO|nr:MULTISPECIES: phosphoribosylaminoimidazolesuccinocarboxamide synthase [Capnocytophaga]EKY11130.1 phosphoribosylaminoimidazolesuccinocarboxamide synthase [Capnocytophaga sp. oral taxon 332 str. F0381]MBO1885141.1 phosphoribosylaminoimidazolesuccinocarboxamide synthase [Capnocytophaga bilenii]